MKIIKNRIIEQRKIEMKMKTFWSGYFFIIKNSFVPTKKIHRKTAFKTFQRYSKIFMIASSDFFFTCRLVNNQFFVYYRRRPMSTIWKCHCYFHTKKVFALKNIKIQKFWHKKVVQFLIVFFSADIQAQKWFEKIS